MKMDGMSVGERLKNIQSRMNEACVRAGRAPDSVRLLAVSKLQNLEKIREAIDSGQVFFGENYVQEAVEKMGQLASFNLQWHFIGRIQSNKAKLLPGNFALVHSVDRLNVIEAMSKHTGEVAQDILLQFNVADEATKAGAEEAELDRMLEFVIIEKPRLRVCGLMVMPPYTENPEQVRPYFKRARWKLEKMREGLAGRNGHPLDQLSMGTSQDFEVAIEEGATWIRIGADVFGPRPEGPSERLMT